MDGKLDSVVVAGTDFPRTLYFADEIWIPGKEKIERLLFPCWKINELVQKVVLDGVNETSTPRCVARHFHPIDIGEIKISDENGIFVGRVKHIYECCVIFRRGIRRAIYDIEFYNAISSH